MTSREFCYWLQGYFEIEGLSVQGEQGSIPQLTTQQTLVIKNHLAMVFKHEIDPSLGTPEHRAKLQEAHEGLSSLHAPPFDPHNTRMMC